MMPIVDPHVHLSRDGYPLENYLAQSSCFHILRLIAVQHEQSAESVLQELQYLRKVATTPGLGGFPNAIVAYCDLTQSDSLDKLCSSEMGSHLCGIHFTWAKENDQRSKDDGHSPVDVSSFWMEPLSLLSSKGLTLDLTISLENIYIIDTIATQFPELTILMTVQDWVTGVDGHGAMQWADQLALVARHDNVYLKICNAFVGNLKDSTEVLRPIAKESVNQLGSERVMFASTMFDQSLSVSFDDQWNSFVDTAAAFKARHRDNLFRSNAIRAYRL